MNGDVFYINTSDVQAYRMNEKLNNSVGNIVG